jgi:hypothetical protein
MSPNESTSTLVPKSEPNTKKTNSGQSAVNPRNLKANLKTPLISSMRTDAPELTNAPGFRAAEAYVRPSPITAVGTILSYGFDLRNCTFTLRLQADEPDGRATEISLPDFHFPKDKCEIQISSGKWALSTDDTDGALIQKLKWWHLGGEQTIKITGVRRSQAMMLGDDEENYLEQCQQSNCSVM